MIDSNLPTVADADQNFDIENESVSLNNRKQKIISGRRRIFIRLRMHAEIVRIIFKNYRNLRKSIRLLNLLVDFRKKALGENKVMKYALVDGKYYMGLYTPGFKSAACEAFILGEANRLMPLGRPVNRFTNILISVTKKCDLKCEHCSEWKTLNEEETLTLDHLKMIVADFQALGVGQIHFSGGEPLQRLDDLLEVINTIDKKTESWVLTSGHKFSFENAKRLKDAGLTGVVVSIDHFIPALHNRFRGSEKSFLWAQNAVKNAIAANLVTAVSICVTREFISDSNLLNYAKMAKEMGVSYIQLFEPKSVGHYAGKNVELTDEHVKTLDDFFFRMNNDKKYCDFPIVLYHGYYQRRVGCFSAGNRHLFVDADGDIHNCRFCRLKSGNAIREDIPQIIDRMQKVGCAKFKALTI